MRIRCLALGGFMALVPASGLAADDYYVSVNGGSDAGPGTFAEPFATIQKAVDSVSPGDTVFILAGTYHEQVVAGNLAGTASDPITIRSYNDEPVTLDGSKSVASIATGGWTLATTAFPGTTTIYQTTLSEDVWQLFIGDKTMISARWPNANWDDDSIWDRNGHWGRGTSSDADGVQYDNGARDLAGSGLDLTGAVALLNVGNWKTWTRTVATHGAGSDQFTYAPIGGAYKPFAGGNHRYFIECKLNLLDVPGEWFYDPGTQKLYLWAENGLDPTGQDVRGKVQSFAFDISDSSHVRIEGLDFFGTTFRTTKCDHMTIEDCDFLYPSYSRRMLGDLGDTSVTTVDTAGSGADSFAVIRNCTFQFTDGPALLIQGRGNLVENCLFSHIDYSVANVGGNGFSIHMSACQGTTYRRNTLYKAGAAEGYRAGGPDPTLPQIVEYNHHHQCGFLQSDGAAFQIGANVERDVIVRYNWTHDTEKYCYRFDGGFHTPDRFSVSNLIHHNVGWDCGNVAFRIKGDEHETYNNVGYDCAYPPIVIRRLSAENTNSITQNNASDVISGKKADPSAAIPGTHDHNWNGRDSAADVRAVLRAPEAWDFRPRPGSPVIDAGRVIAGITDGHVGSKPDIGAYEFGSDEYWIAGYQAAKASTPIPPDRAGDQPRDRDLIFLIGYEGVEADVYLGTTRSAVANATTASGEYRITLPDPKNIYTPAALDPGVTYFWRVDTVRADGTTIAGDVWRFTTADATPAAHHWRFEGDAADSIGGVTGTLVGGANPGAPGDQIEGSFCLGLNGAGQRVAFFNEPTLEDAFSAYTVSAWFKAGTVDAAEPQEIYEEGNLAGGGIAMRLNGAVLEGAVSGGSNATASIGGVTAGRWHHAAVTYDGAAGELFLYLDGVLATSTSAPPASVPAHTNNAAIGAVQGADAFGVTDGPRNHFGGRIDDVRIYDGVALTYGEIIGLHAEDTDGDGLPNSWELANFATLSATDGTGDTDGDGASDRDEFSDGTDPNDPGSYLRVSPGAHAGNQFTVEWPSETGRSYRLWWSVDMANWTAYTSELGDGGTINIPVDPAPLGTPVRVFFRVTTP